MIIRLRCERHWTEEGYLTCSTAMRRRRCQIFLFLSVTLGFLSTVIVIIDLDLSEVDSNSFSPNTIRPKVQDNANDHSDQKTNASTTTILIRQTHLQIPQLDENALDPCNGCRKHINKVLGNYSLNWRKNVTKHQELRSSLITNCNGFQTAFVTQANSPLGTSIKYDGDKSVRRVDENIFNNIPKEVKFSNKVLDTCSVVGNGGILMNSSCGEAIDSAQFVIRCNLPPLDKEYGKHVGRKTNIVTANPTIIQNTYNGLRFRRRQFVDDLSIYGDSLLFLPAFSFAFCTGLSMAVHYTLDDFRSPVKAVFFNPEYLKSLHTFWHSQKVKLGFRISTGFMMVSLALEICNNVDVYGFWPFGYHPYTFQITPHHYYDNQKASGFHAMPAEFAYLIKLHNEGVLKLHLRECPPQK